MKVSQDYINKMQDKGFYVATGLAILNDIVAVALTYPQEMTRAMRLKTPESVKAFNDDLDSKDWVIFRKQSETEL